MDEMKWTCFCGNIVEDGTVCDNCCLTVIGSDIKKNPGADKTLTGLIDEVGGMDWSAVKYPEHLTKITDMFIAEYLDARFSHALMHSPHEGFAIIQEEYDELWDEIKNDSAPIFLRKEAIQLGAMVLAFINEVTPPKSD